LGAPAPEQATATAMLTPSDPIAGRQHWAFQPLRASPAILLGSSENRSEPWRDQLQEDRANSTNFSNPIDAWLEHQRAKQQVQSAPRAEPSVLLRRLHYALHGLPPTAEELSEFESSRGNTDAMSQTVDRLLSSPRYGERWGRHWLDLARYADSNGSDENFLFREAWRYRNWVFQAFNNDLPFDQFTVMQIAGDLLPFESIEQRDQQRVATGFMLLGPKVLLGNIPENQKMEIADEQIDTIGRIYFAQTLGCARCHDHKFDPVPTKDYYSLAGIFTSTQVMEQRYMLGEQRVMEQLIGLGEEGDSLDGAYEQYWRERPNLGKKKDKAKKALDALKEPDDPEFDEIATESAEAIAPEAKDKSRSMEERLAAQQAMFDQLKKAWDAPPAIPPRAMVCADKAAPAGEPIRAAGQYNKPTGDAIPRGFLSVISDQAVALPEKSSGRLELAKWLTVKQQLSGQLTARVIANRVWHHLMGRGIVRTVDNFGRTGEEPAHPELLDFLAQELIDNNWSLKHLIKTIVMSEAFQLSSQFNAENYQRDPDNVYCWRYSRRRLDPEAFRDSTLSVAGLLDTNEYLSTVDYLGDQATAVGANTVRRKTDFPCRSVYLPVIRNDLPELFELLDFTDPQVATGMRRSTIVPTQGLFMLNDDQLMDAAAKLAERIASLKTEPQDRICELFVQIVGATPGADEVETLMKSYNRLLDAGTNSATDQSLAALATIAHALFASSRFQFIE
jgi:Protein of unknown function (DUF1553)/Protein of unknown function (DUF1549)